MYIVLFYICIYKFNINKVYDIISKCLLSFFSDMRKMCCICTHKNTQVLKQAHKQTCTHTHPLTYTQCNLCRQLRTHKSVTKNCQ